jgi:hypothetical protein
MFSLLHARGSIRWPVVAPVLDAPVDEHRPGDLIRAGHFVEHLSHEVVPHEPRDHGVVGDDGPDGHPAEQLEGEVREAGREVEACEAGGEEEVGGEELHRESLEGERKGVG